MWLSDVFDDYGDIVVPNADRFVIRGGNKSTVLVNEGDGVHGSQMLVVLLGDLRRIHVVLERGRQCECHTNEMQTRQHCSIPE